MTPTNPREEKVRVGICVVCVVCGRVKKPHGRSALFPLRYCDDRCAGYYQDPQPGCLWAGETEEDFGYPVCEHATELRDRKWSDDEGYREAQA